MASEPSTHTRRRLADVLSAQNSVAEAINQYQEVINSAEPDEEDMKIALAGCEGLLASLGRTEEIEQIEALKAELGL